MARGDMPEILFVKPIGGGRVKAKHQHTVFKVIDHHPSGAPKNCVLVENHETVNVDEGMEFITAYVPSVNFQKRKGNS